MQSQPFRVEIAEGEAGVPFPGKRLGESDKHILVVEDNAALRQVMRAVLEAAGYRVACAANGREALDSLRAAEPPFVILLDLSMPVMDGWQFRERQRQTAGFASIPVLLLS